MADQDLEALLADLEARLTRLEDERGIIDTLHRYGQAADDGREIDWAELFVEDGVFLSCTREGTVILEQRGREALRAWLRGFRQGETKLSKHCVFAPVITIDGQRAVVESYSMRLIENDDPFRSPIPLLMGRYHDQMVKGSDGRWRFVERLALLEAPRIAGPAAGTDDR